MQDALKRPPPPERWSHEDVAGLYALPFSTLLHRAHEVHRAHFPAGDVQISTLLSIKTGACPEDCAYCPQSVHFDTSLGAERLMPASRVRLSAGRESMSDELQALCFHAGANSIFCGEQLLTTANPATGHDRALFERLGLTPAA